MGWSGRLCFIAALLPGPAAVLAAQAPGARVAHGVTAAQARDIIVHGNRVWGAARVAVDTVAFDSMLIADFYAQIGDSRLDKRQFIARISPVRGPRLVRFDVTVLTVRPTERGWVAVIEEKLEMEGTTPDGRPLRAYSLWVTKDEWRPIGDRWLIASTEALGNESWLNERPPFADW